MKYLSELVKENGDILARLSQCFPVKDLQKYTTEDVFNYSDRHGGTFDSFKYYNDYVILVKKNKVRKKG